MDKQFTVRGTLTIRLTDDEVEKAIEEFPNLPVEDAIKKMVELTFVDEVGVDTNDPDMVFEVLTSEKENDSE